MAILFQSHKTSTINVWETQSKRWTLGDEWSDLRAYTPDDDSRDIVWKRSTDPLHITSKRREFEQSLRLIFCVDENIGDTFTLPNSAPSRWKWKKQSLSLLEISAKKLRFPFQTFHGKLSQQIENLIKSKTKNTLIIILSSDTDIWNASISALSYHNDVVIVQVKHPFEIKPDTSVWIQGQVFDTKKQEEYQKAREEKENQYKQYCKKQNISPIFLDTHQSIETSLNHFFKYRYAKKR